MCAASGSAEDISALSLALQIIDASQELQQTVTHLRQLMPDSKALAGQAAAGLPPSDAGAGKLHATLLLCLGYLALPCLGMMSTHWVTPRECLCLGLSLNFHVKELIELQTCNDMKNRRGSVCHTEVFIAIASALHQIGNPCLQQALIQDHRPAPEPL